MWSMRLKKKLEHKLINYFIFKKKRIIKCHLIFSKILNRLFILEGERVEVSGICNLCGRPGKMYTCSLCGGIVCGNCYNLQKGVCKSCEHFRTGDVSKSLR